MLIRQLAPEILSSLQKAPVVALLGSRQTGKTTLAKTLSSTLMDRRVVYLDLELDSDRSALARDELFLEAHTDALVIIDEVQRLPSLFPHLRALVDRNRRPGRFLLLGSASPDLIRHSAESLAGRIRYLELSPLVLAETAPSGWRELWLRGGYPESYLAPDDAESYRWRLDFLSTYLERDLPTLGTRLPAVQLRRCLTMLAHQQGQLWNASQYGTSLGLSAPTVKHYLDVLTDTYLARSLTPYHANVGKRLVKSPKSYLRDSGLVHALLGIQTWDQLLSHPVVGHSWEGFVIETILRTLPLGWQGFFYRTSAGAEMDLVLLRPDGITLGIEVKFSQNPTLTKGFYLSAADLDTGKNFVVYPGTHLVPLDERTQLLPLEQLNQLWTD